MPIIASSKKTLRRAIKRAEENVPVRSKARNAVKKMKKTPSAENLQVAFSAVDRAVKKNIFHKNKAGRIKAQLSKLLAKLGGEKETAPKAAKTAPKAKAKAKKSKAK